MEERFLGLLAWQALREYTEGLPQRTDESVLEALRRVGGCSARSLPAPEGTALRASVGCFVTLLQNGELRGCVGNAEGREPLYIAVQALARAAASRDSRFQPVDGRELHEISGEITILGQCVLCPGGAERLLEFVSPGEHGIRIRRGERSALLLPKVAGRLGWDALELLDQVAIKAGLPRDSWRDPGTEVFAFTARSFGAIAFAG
jgi:AmmeMemoRadiSam system protein A